MRLKANMWVMAFVRRINGVGGGGAVAMIARHGDDEAGAVYIKVARLDRTAALYGPAPAGMDGLDADRRWVEVMPAASDEFAVDEAIRRAAGFDSDLWVIEIEDRQGRHFLDDWLAPG